jgi:hypothetical protein
LSPEEDGLTQNSRLKTHNAKKLAPGLFPEMPEYQRRQLLGALVRFPDGYRADGRAHLDVVAAAVKRRALPIRPAWEKAFECVDGRL